MSALAEVVARLIDENRSAPGHPAALRLDLSDATKMFGQTEAQFLRDVAEGVHKGELRVASLLFFEVEQ